MVYMYTYSYNIYIYRLWFDLLVLGPRFASERSQLDILPEYCFPFRAQTLASQGFGKKQSQFKRKGLPLTYFGLMRPKGFLTGVPY